MKHLKRLLFLALCLVGLTGCGGEDPGQLLSVSVGDTPVSLDPIYAEVTGDQSILTGLYENLMKVTSGPDGVKTVANGMAKSVSQSQNTDGTMVYTFKLRSAKWSDGKPVTAQDFVYAWQRLANPASQSPYASLLSVVSGYDDARQTGDMSLLQVVAKNDSTLVVTLDGRFDWFLTEVCTSPATMPLRQDVIQTLKEQNQDNEVNPSWWADPTALVTNGPYVVTEYTPGEAMVTAANEQYDRTHAGPSGVLFAFAEDEEAAWQLYEDKEVDMVWPLPQQVLEELAKKKDLTPIPALSTHAVLFNYQQEQLADPLVRRAMHLVIDRTALAQAQGTTVFPAEGLVPPGVPESEEGDFRTVGGPSLDNDPEHYEERVEEARQLLDEAGHGQGASLEPMEYLYIDEGSNGVVAQMITRTWKDTLNLTVIPRGVSELDLWIALREGNYQLVGVDLVSPGNDAECFLMQWTSDSHDNLVAYENSAYDTLMNVIATAGSEQARMACLHDAEELLLSDDVVIPLYTDTTGWLMRDSLSGLSRDPRGWFSFDQVMGTN